MEQLSTYKECVEKLSKIYPDLRKIPNFHYADVGYKIVEGKQTNEFAIRIYIHGAKSIKEISEDFLIPQHFDGIQTDIIETYEITKKCPLPDIGRTQKVNPLIGGISIGPFDKVSTLGIICHSKVYGLCALTTFHDSKYIKSEIFQPSPQENAASYVKIGEVVDHAKEYDISLLKLDDSMNMYSDILELLSPVEFATWETIENLNKLKTSVYKSGRTTGVTSGIISGIWGPSQRITIASYDGNIISCPGDSGSIWMTEDGQIIGVHSRGTAENLAKCYSVNKLLNYWGISLIQNYT